MAMAMDWIGGACQLLHVSDGSVNLNFLVCVTTCWFRNKTNSIEACARLTINSSRIPVACLPTCRLGGEIIPRIIHVGNYLIRTLNRTDF